MKWAEKGYFAQQYCVKGSQLHRKPLFILIMLIAAMPAIFATGCAGTRSKLEVCTGNNTALYADNSWRSTKWAQRGSSFVIIADRCKTGGVLYEPYPRLEKFARVVVVAEHGEVPKGKVAIIFPAKICEYRLESIQDDGNKLRAIAANGQDQVHIVIVGVVNADYETLRQEADTLMNGAQQAR